MYFNVHVQAQSQAADSETQLNVRTEQLHEAERTIQILRQSVETANSQVEQVCTSYLRVPIFVNSSHWLDKIELSLILWIYFSLMLYSACLQ